MLEYRLIGIRNHIKRAICAYLQIPEYTPRDTWIPTRLVIPGYLQLSEYRTDGSNHGSLSSGILYVGGILPSCNVPCY
jgi:hypothetical protein